MKFLVFIKQVPNTAEIQFDPAKKTLIRSGVKTEINPYDRRALSEAIRYRNENGGEVIAITMGPDCSRDGLLESLIMGVDSAIHIKDSRLAGSDTLATSRVLAAVARKLGFDIIFCGQHSTDSETGQVPVEVAELLQIPCATAVTKIEYLQDRTIQPTCETEEGWMRLEMRLPAVISTAERLIKPIKTKNVDLSTAPTEKIREFKIDDLGLLENEVGFSGSPTWVADIRDVRVIRTPESWDGSDVPATACKLLKLCSERGGRAAESVDAVSNNPSEYWCWVETFNDRISPVSFEMISAAATLGTACARVKGTLTREVKEELSQHGATKIFALPSDLHLDESVSTICEKVQTNPPFAVLFPATTRGRYLAGRIAARLQLGLTGDCVGLDLDEQGRLAQLKPAFGGNIVAPIYSRTFPHLATIRAGALRKIVRSNERTADVVRWNIPADVHLTFSILAHEMDMGAEAGKLDEARVAVCIGAGIGESNIPLANRLSSLLDASLGATRRVVDLGWLPRQYQIGLTGKFIAPEVYLGFAISGRYNHMIGVQKAGTLVAINSDPNAEVFKVVDVGVVGDAVEIMNEMVRQLEDTN